jgi:hypothetical protein
MRALETGKKIEMLPSMSGEIEKKMEKKIDKK